MPFWREVALACQELEEPFSKLDIAKLMVGVPVRLIDNAINKMVQDGTLDSVGWVEDREGPYRRLRTYVLGEFDPKDEYSSYSAERRFAQLMGDKRYEDWYTPDVIWRGLPPATYVAAEAST